MSLRRPRFQEEEEAQTINISPLIDVIFILLIFFIVTMAFADSRAMKVDAPKAAQTAEISAEITTVVIGADGVFYLDGRPCSTAELSSALTARFVKTKSVAIRSDASVSVDRLVAAMDCAKSAGAEEIYVSADKK